MHWLLQTAWTSRAADELSYGFLVAVEERQRFDTNPLYAILHEAIYCQPGMPPSAWSAGASSHVHFPAIVYSLCPLYCFFFFAQCVSRLLPLPPTSLFFLLTPVTNPHFNSCSIHYLQTFASRHALHGGG